MKEYFSDEHRKNGLDIVVIEDDDVTLTCEYIEGSGKNYILTGKALIDGEIYHDFKVEFELLELPEEETISCIMDMDWDWYDFLC